MLEGIKGALRSALDRSVEPSLSIRPESKAGAISFDLVAANTLQRNGYYKLAASLAGGMPAWSGEPVNNSTAMGLSVVWACTRIISESVGFLPLNLMKRDGAKNAPATFHPMYNALSYAPNCENTAQQFTELLTGHCVLGGNSYSQIIRRSGTGTAVELLPLLPDNVLVDRERTGDRRLVYVVKEPNQPDKSYVVQRGVPQDIFHMRGLGWDGTTGYSVIHMAKQSMGTAIAQERNVAAFYAAGGRVPYLLKTANAQAFADDADFDAFRADWEATYAQPHKAPILENGIEYQQIGLSAADAQLLESRQFTIPEICRWFSVSPHLVGDLSRATFSNIESLADQFVRFTLMTWLTRWESELWRCVLTPDEQASGLYFTHDLSPLLQSDFKARMDSYAQMLQCGKNSINEVRQMEGENPIPGGDDHYVQVNLAPVGAGATTSSSRVKVTGD